MPNHAHLHTPFPAHKPEAISAQIVIVGASLAGCVCALALAERGWYVHVLEQRQAIEQHKKLCTHIIHPSGVRTLRSLGLWHELAAHSAQNSYMRIHHGKHWLSFPFNSRPAAANIERKDLDPLLRKKLLNHPSIQLHAGYRLSTIHEKAGSVSGIDATHAQSGALRRFATPLLIAADGRRGDTAKLAGARQHNLDNNRVALFAYFDYGCAPEHSQVWVREAGQEYIGCFPNREHILVSWYISKAHYAQIKSRKEEAFSTLGTFLGAQGILLGERTSPIMSAVDTGEQMTHGGLKGFVAIGDAKLAADPLTGVGCAWAIASAEKLAVCLGHASPSYRHIRWALWRYAAWHRWSFSLPSRAMSLASLHGPWIFNPWVFPILARLTGGEQSATRPASGSQ